MSSSSKRKDISMGSSQKPPKSKKKPLATGLDEVQRMLMKDRLSKIIPALQAAGVKIRRDQRNVYFAGNQYSYKEFLLYTNLPSPSEQVLQLLKSFGKIHQFRPAEGGKTAIKLMPEGEWIESQFIACVIGESKVKALSDLLIAIEKYRIYWIQKSAGITFRHSPSNWSLDVESFEKMKYAVDKLSILMKRIDAEKKEGQERVIREAKKKNGRGRISICGTIGSQPGVDPDTRREIIEVINRGMLPVIADGTIVFVDSQTDKTQRTEFPTIQHSRISHSRVKPANQNGLNNNPMDGILKNDAVNDLYAKLEEFQDRISNHAKELAELCGRGVFSDNCDILRARQLTFILKVMLKSALKVKATFDEIRKKKSE